MEGSSVLIVATENEVLPVPDLVCLCVGGGGVVGWKLAHNTNIGSEDESIVECK
jgi:hypothetical protein